MEIMMRSTIECIVVSYVIIQSKIYSGKRNHVINSAKTFCGHGSKDSQACQQHAEGDKRASNHSGDCGPVAEDDFELNAFPQHAPGAEDDVRGDAEIRTESDETATGDDAASKP